MAISSRTVHEFRPLLLMQVFDLPEDLHEKLKYIADFDMTRQRNALLENHTRVSSDEEISSSEIDLIEQEFKRFLSLPLLFPTAQYPFVPSGKVDAMWHKFILDTKRYREFCDNVYGEYLDHTPQDTLGATIATNKAMYFFTKECLKEAYGGWIPAIWGVSAHCDTVQCTA